MLLVADQAALKPDGLRRDAGASLLHQSIEVLRQRNVRQDEQTGQDPDHPTMIN